MKQTRMKAEARKEDILAAALRLAERRGYTAITRNDIAEAAGVRGPTLHHHFGTMAKLRKELMRYAIRVGGVKVIAQGIVANDPQAMRLSEDLRKRALAAF